MNFQLGSSIALNTKALIIPVLKNQHLAHTLSNIADKHQLSSPQLSEDFQANQGEHLLVYSQASALKVFLVGLGDQPNFGSILKTFRSFGHQQKKRLNKNTAIDLSDLEQGNEIKKFNFWVEAAVNGLLLSTYKISLYKENAKEELHPFAQKDSELQIISSVADEKILIQSLNKAKATAETQMQIFDLVNAPGNKVRPIELANWAKKSAAENGFTTKVLYKEDIILEGLDALLAVNRGSEWPPAFIIMEYQPEGVENAPSFGFVGKGVTFDTGGLSIKGSNRMHYMKSDMGGAAAVLGAMELTAKLKLPVHLIGIVPTTDNCVDAESVKPGDVINSYSGKTIEIIDTDAEGRLILADALAYMRKNFQPEVIIDLATLTGSCVRALGYQAGGLFTANDQLANQLINSGEGCGERLWRLPLWAEYRKDMDSDIADIKNFSGRPVAGAITAAKFLEAFTDDHPAWAHLDIAGVAFGDSEFSGDKSASAYGVRLLVEFLKSYSDKQ